MHFFILRHFTKSDMELFAVMDDSMVWQGGLYVYTHALIVVEEIPQVLVFTGGKREVYTHENDIKEFITSNVNGHNFYACEHYVRYHTIWPLVREVAQRMPGPVKKLFTEAHHTAKNAAKRKLDELLAAAQ